MPPNPNPVFRQEIIPWYDSHKICLLTLIIMCMAFLFSIAGISVAIETADYKNYVWVPLLTALSSAWIILSIGIRLFKRYLNRFQR